MKTSPLQTLSRILFIFTIALYSCGDDGDDNPLGLPLKDDGFFVVNEGAFGNSNTSLSFYSLETSSATNSIFQLVNQRPLGDQSQSMAIHDDFGYIVVQNSGKIEVIDVDNFESVATITDGLTSPRYFVALDDETGYVSDWGDGFTGSVKVIDLENFTVTQSIETGSGSNQMVIRNGWLYVANSGGFGTDNTITVINTQDNSIVKEIETGDNPSNLALDRREHIWVLGKGALAFDADFNLVPENSTPGFVSRIDENDNLLSTIELTDITFNTADDLVVDVDNNLVYFNYNSGVWRLALDDTELSSNPFIPEGLYGLGLDPTSGNLIGTAAPDFTSGGQLIFYDNMGAVTSSIITGIGPNSIVYKD